VTTTTTAPAPARSAGRYVGAIDGLRAIAVAAVIVFHFSPSVLPAGFLGVDVFFVVSGFLIARLIVAELDRRSSVDLGNFWGRRARRLLPALGTVTVVVCIACAISFSNAELQNIRGQALGTIFYCANWVMIHQKANYFATLGRPSPFLHMWTLAVEEQFYIVLPLVCLAFRRAIVRHPVRAAWIAFAGAIASTAWMAYLVSPHGDPSRAYLGTDSHAMGLLVGVALGILAGKGAPWEKLTARVRRYPSAATFGATVALVAMIVVMRVVKDHTYNLYRGGFLVFSVWTAIVVVVVVASPESRVTRVLGTRPLVEIGLRSYSLYLWHWPVRVFVTPRPGLHGFSLFVVRLAISIVLAELSYRLVERPFRTGAIAKRSGSRGAVSYYVVTAAVTIVLVFTVAAPGPLPPSSLDAGATTTPAGTFRVDTFGDSTALVFGLAGRNHASQLDLSVGGDAILGCGVVQADHMSQGQIIPLPRQCAGWQERWTNDLKQDPAARLMLMTGAWDILDHRVNGHDVKFGTPEWHDLVSSSLRDALTTLTSDGRPVYLFDVPCYGAGDPSAPIPERGDPKRIAALNDIYADAARANPHVVLVHWRSLVCPYGHRVEQLAGHPAWQADNVHLTDAGALTVWQWWLPQVRGRH
jgi:peptidoglycan/LPS O-acetylase OafA/YrhL